MDESCAMQSREAILTGKILNLPSENTMLKINFNPSNAELNAICHLLALLGAHLILHVSWIRVNYHKY